MMIARLTALRGPATRRLMEASGRKAGRSGWRAKVAPAVLAMGAMALSGCISVNAPDKPIVIELNINIKQEVIYRLAADAADTIEANPDIF
jgi:anti-sigma-K factor RskA